MLYACIKLSNPARSAVSRCRLVAKQTALVALSTLLHIPGECVGQLRRVQEDPTPMFFGRGTKQMRTLWANPTAETIELHLSTRVFQASSATAIPDSGP